MKNDTFPESIEDRYQVIEKTGSGGMGVVFRAHDPVLGIDVAIKVLACDPTGLTAARLQREAMAAGKLNHQNIAKVFDFGQTRDGAPYMVMEYVKGQNLSELIRQQGFLAFEQAQNIFVQICQGLQVAHSQKIIHRDLKPSNIMVVDALESKQLIKLLDFGVAKLEAYSQDLTRTGALLGSPLYMSPEQAQGDEADARSDIYSLGCLMYECLIGDPPFKGDTTLETISYHKSKAPFLISEVVPDADFPPELVELVDSMLSKSPQSRPQTVLEVKDRLSQMTAVQKKYPELTEIHSGDTGKAIKPAKSIFGQSPAVAAMIGIFSLAFLSFIFVMISASINTQKLKKQNEIIANSGNKPIFRNNLKDQKNKVLVSMIAQKKSTMGDGTSSTITSIELDDADFATFSKNTDHLDVSRSDLRREQLLNLTKMNLKSLVLNGSELDDKSIKYLTKIKTLEKLTCGVTKLTDTGFSELSKFPRLQMLSISTPYVSAKAFLSLKDLPYLTYLQVDNNNLDDSAAFYLSRLPHLSSLFLKSNKLTDKGFAEMKRMPELVVLTVNSPQITDAALSHLKDMKKLNMIALERCNLTPDFALKMRPNKNLVQLSLIQQGPMSVASARALAKMSLQTLVVQNSPIYDDQLIALCQAKQLYTIYLGNSPVTIKGINGVKSPPLSVLHMKEYRDLTNAIIKKISSLKFLHSIDFSNSNLNDEQLLTLARLPNLQNLILDGCPGLTAEGVMQFETLFFSLHQRKCTLKTSNVISRDLQEGDKFEKGMKDWRRKN